MSYRIRRYKAFVSPLVLGLMTGSGACSSIDASDSVMSVDNDGGAPAGGNETSDGQTGASGGLGSDESGDGDGDDTPESAGERDDPPFDDHCGDGQTPIAMVAADADALAVPVIARTAILLGQEMPANLSLGPRSFLNYYNFDYPPASDRAELTVHADLWIDEQGPDDKYQLQIGIASEAMLNANRPPLHLTIVLDRRTPMSERTALVDAGLLAVSSSLHSGDRVSLIASGDMPYEILGDHAVSGSNDPRLVDSAQDFFNANPIDLEETPLDATIALAYSRAEAGLTTAATHRILLLTSGHGEISSETLELAATHTVGAEGESIRLVGVGLGTIDSSGDNLVDKLSDAGRGSSLYATRTDDLVQQLGEQFVRHFVAAATRIKAELILPEGLQPIDIHDADNSDPQYASTPQDIQLGPNDTLIFHIDLEQCADFNSTDSLAVRLRWTDPATSETKFEDFPFDLIPDNLSDSRPFVTHKGAAVVAYATALSTVQKNGRAEPLTLFSAQNKVESALLLQPQDVDLIEMSTVLAELDLNAI